MPSPSNIPRKKRRLGPPIDLDELYNAPSNRGMCSFLERPPEEARVRLEERLKVDRAEAEAQARAEIEITAAGIMQAGADRIIPGAGDVQVDVACKTPGGVDIRGVGGMKAAPILHPVVELPAPVFKPWPTVVRSGAKLPRIYMQRPQGGYSKIPAPGVLLGEIVSPGGRITKIQRCVLAQDAHSSGEQVLYLSMWNEAAAEREDTRQITVGMGSLSRMARMDISNVRKNLRSLVEKLSLEVIAEEISGVQQGKTYRVFSYRRILENRRQAGLEWIIKSKGVSFIDPAQYGIVQAPGVMPAPGSIQRGATGDMPAADPGNPPAAGGGKLPAEAPGSLQAFISKEVRNTTEETSSSDVPADLGGRIRAILSPFDDDAVQTLWRTCRSQAGDCTAEEVEYCFQVKADQLLRRGKNVTNPVGLMLWAVPKCFEGSQGLHLAHRDERRAEQARQAQAEEENRRRAMEYRRLAEDPASSEEDRAWYLRLSQQG